MAENEFKCRTWRYGPNGEAQIFTDSRDVPEGWLDHPAKHENPHYPYDSPADPVTQTIPADHGDLEQDAADFAADVGQVACDVLAQKYFGRAGVATRLKAVEDAAQLAEIAAANSKPAEFEPIPLKRKEIIAQLTERKIAFRVTATTAVLYTLLLSAMEREDEREDLSDEGQSE